MSELGIKPRSVHDDLLDNKIVVETEAGLIFTMYLDEGVATWTTRDPATNRILGELPGCARC